MDDELQLWTTKPATPAGRYLRLFWHPVYVSENLKPGKAVIGITSVSERPTRRVVPSAAVHKWSPIGIKARRVREFFIAVAKAAIETKNGPKM